MLKNFIRSFFEANIGKLNKDWRLIKSLIKKEIQSHNFEAAIVLIEQACNLAYTYNFVPDYKDLEIEQFIQEVTKDVQGDKLIATNKIKNRIVFFDHFVLENRGFTQQYLDAFIDAGVEVLYVIDNPKNYNKQNRIIQIIEAYEKGSVAVLRSSSRLNKLDELLNVVIQFEPSKVFIHTAPWEILSCCMAFELQRKTLIKCYLLNITDHAFWPGITCFEYIIDWRSLGYNINKTLKDKPPEKLLLIPTPVYLDEAVPFQGFPAIPSGKVIGFSGGSYYKIVDENDTFLHLIKDVLNRNENFIFLFAIIGGEEKMQRFIKENHFENRLFLIGNRKDIDEVYKRIDIYFNTYPYGGGLMLQYAMQRGKPILALWSPGLYHTRLDLVFDCQLSEDHIIFDRSTYVEIASKLINDPIYRDQYVNYYEQVKKVLNGFKERVGQLLGDMPIDSVYMSEFEIDQKAVTDFHIENERIQKRDYPLWIYRIVRASPLKKIIFISAQALFFKIFRRLKMI